LVRVRRAPRAQELVVVNATDPLNLVGVIVPGLTVPAVRTNQVMYVDGLPMQVPVSELSARGV
jgi:ATP-dependent Lhr-like helicase